MSAFSCAIGGDCFLGFLAVLFLRVFGTGLSGTAPEDGGAEQT
jgi:hypothetical protein